MQMLDINKLRNAYNVIHRMSQNRHPFAEEELSLEVVQSAQVQEALADAAEVIAVYGKIMNLVSQSTSFKVAPKTPKAVKSSFVVEQDDLSRLQPMTEATNITKLVKYINDTFADKEMHNLTTVELGRWLENTGYLQLPEDGRNKIPTEKGSALGIVTEKRVSQATGEIYYINLYPQAAQQFIFANLPAVAEFLAKEKEEKLADA
jgi:hypothetical protein